METSGKNDNAMLFLPEVCCNQALLRRHGRCASLFLLSLMRLVKIRSTAVDEQEFDGQNSHDRDAEDI